MTEIAQVGSISQAFVSTSTPVSVPLAQGTTKGNALVYLARVSSDVGGNRAIASVTGGGATWTQLLNYQPFGISIRHFIYLGIINTSTASGNITCTHSGSNTTTNSAAMMMEVTAGLGPDTLWEVDGTPGTWVRGGNGTTIPFPSQTPEDIDRAYFGWGTAGVATTYGSPPAGFSFLAQTGSSVNGMIWRLSCPVSAMAPSMVMPSGNSSSVSVLIKARNPKHGIGMMGQGGLAHNDDELSARRYDRRRSGMYVPKQRELIVCRAA